MTTRRAILILLIAIAIGVLVLLGVLFGIDVNAGGSDSGTGGTGGY